MRWLMCQHMAWEMQSQDCSCPLNIFVPILICLCWPFPQSNSSQQIYSVEDGRYPCFKRCPRHSVQPRRPGLLRSYHWLLWCTSPRPPQLWYKPVLLLCGRIYPQSLEHARRYEIITVCSLDVLAASCNWSGPQAQWWTSQCADCWSPAWWVVRGGCAEHTCSSSLVPKIMEDCKKLMWERGWTVNERDWGGEEEREKLSGKKGFHKEKKKHTFDMDTVLSGLVFWDPLVATVFVRTHE